VCICTHHYWAKAFALLMTHPPVARMVYQAQRVRQALARGATANLEQAVYVRSPTEQAIRMPMWAPEQYSPLELESASLLGPFFRVSVLGDDEVRVQRRLGAAVVADLMLPGTVHPCVVCTAGADPPIL